MPRLPLPVTRRGQFTPRALRSRSTPVQLSVDSRYFYRVIKEFKRLTGIPMILNTSLNRKGEPIAETPDDALQIFTDEDVDVLFIEELLFVKRACSETGNQWPALVSLAK